jgi:hypothetical protein
MYNIASTLIEGTACFSRHRAREGDRMRRVALALDRRSIVVLAVLARMREPAQLDLDLAVAAGPAATQPADHPAPTR